MENDKPCSPSSCAALGEEVEETGKKLSLGRGDWYREGVFRFVVISH